jgi:S-formylglutathione hydrolase FrmB
MALSILHYFSPALGRQTAANVLLPEAMEAGVRYPVLYLLHGLSDDYTMWLRRSSVERHAGSFPLIVVMPDGGRGFYTDAFAGDQYLTAIATELVNRIDRTFPTQATRAGRCIAGLSMGGYGALKAALSFPDRFAAAVSMSGAANWGHRTENRDGTPLSAEWQRLLGPEPVGGPNDLWALADGVAAAPEIPPALRIDCGVDDFLIEDNREFHAHLDAIGLTHTYDEYPGAHNWDYWDLHVQDAIAFCGQTIRSPVAEPTAH